MRRRDFNAAVEEARRGLALERMSTERDRRIRERLAGQSDANRIPKRQAIWVMAGVSTLAVLAVIALQPSGLSEVAFVVEERSSDVELTTHGDELAMTGGRCVVHDARGGATVTLEGQAVIARTPLGIHVRSGQVTLDVLRRMPGAPPYSVRVSLGRIDVLGTRFTIIERVTAGEVRLEEGAIAFTSDDGRFIRLSPGDRLRWPLEAEQKPSPSGEVGPPAESPRRSPERLARRKAPADNPAPPKVVPEEAAALEVLLARIDALRTRGDDAGVIEELKRALERPHDPTTRERLSFELGATLTHRRRDARACAHWDWHEAEFSASDRYDREIAIDREQLKCTSTNRGR